MLRIIVLMLLLWPVPLRAGMDLCCFFSDNVVRTVSPTVGTTSVVVAPANPNRRGLIIYNNSSNSVYLTYGPVSVGSTCTRILGSFTQFEMLGAIIYTGVISGIRNSGTGTLTITEIQ